MSFQCIITSVAQSVIEPAVLCEHSINVTVIHVCI